MKKIYYILILATIWITGLTACNKYLDIKPKGYQLLLTTADYDQWLNNIALQESEPIELNQLQDNTDEPNITTPATGSTDLAYLWAPQFDETIGDIPLFWSVHYQSINLFNTVIDNVGSATGPDNLKASLKAEALLGRALEYLYLVNEYGKAYDSATSASDLAVPFVTSNDVATPVPSRSTVQQIYDNIFADINAAIPNLPADNFSNRSRGSVAAAYAVMARAYLFMRNYTQAQKYAQMVLDNGPNTIVDYNNITSANPMATYLKQPDAIYTRYSAGVHSGTIPTQSFLSSFDKNDLRLQFYYTNLGNYNFPRGITSYVPYVVGSGASFQNWGPTVTEMRLIIAEAAARGGDMSMALQQLDNVRKCRIAKDTYQSYQSAVPDSVLQHVLNERTFEFGFTGMRWFDMRRLNAEGRMGTINRYDGSNNVVATLAPNSPRYILQIPIQEMYYHSTWPQNP